ERTPELHRSPPEIRALLPVAPRHEEVVRGERERVRRPLTVPERDVGLELTLDEGPVLRHGYRRARDRLPDLFLERPRVGREEGIRPAVFPEQVRDQVRREAAEGADLEHRVARRELRDGAIEAV